MRARAAFGSGNKNSIDQIALASVPLVTSNSANRYICMMISDKESKQVRANGYVPFMGTLNEQQIANGMLRFVQTVKIEREKATALEVPKSANLIHH
jgi:protein tyrosine phosphatase